MTDRRMHTPIKNVSTKSGRTGSHARLRGLLWLAFLSILPVLSGCSEKTSETPHAGAESTQGAATPPGADSSASPTKIVPLDTSMPFERRVLREYAAQGVAIPKRVSDSIVALKDPRRIEEALDRYMHHHDSLVRSSIARRNGITVDSLGVIIRMGDSSGPSRTR